jgi:co-chaperonin GroES (HSP10)
MSLLRAFGHNVIVQLLPPKTMHSSLLIIPQSYQKEPGQGIIKQIGNNVKYIKIGDHVVFEEKHGEAINSKGYKYVLIHERYLTFTVSSKPVIIPGVYFQDELTGNYVEATDESLFQAIILEYNYQGKKVDAQDLVDHNLGVYNADADLFEEEDDD